MKWRAKILMATVPIVFFTGAALTGIPFENAFANGSAEKNVVIERIVAYLKGKDVDMKEDKLKAVVHKVYDEAEQYDLDYRLALAVIKVESNFKHDVVSRKGARGLFQIKPSLAKYIAKDAGVTLNGDQSLHEPDKNIKLGLYHLSKLVEDFKNLPTALHAYNVGITKTKARRAGKGEPNTTFTKRVLKEYEKNLSVLPERDDTER
ncbi:MAG: lytic murein transglycosylase [Syntrophorhabdaceae bacterium PtaU1.Bin034]|nr:MAG: lytic murein transglycosylase [Syntrophorhabdaceae bacterium PtaU1.Bin034]